MGQYLAIIVEAPANSPKYPGANASGVLSGRNGSNLLPRCRKEPAGYNSARFHWNELSSPFPQRHHVTEKHKRILNKIGKIAAYMALTAGSYILSRGVDKEWSQKISQKRKGTRKRVPPDNPLAKLLCTRVLEILSAGLDKLI
jgi:hypothetical protein